MGDVKPISEASGSEIPAPAKKRERPTETLPTDRITFSKQIDILRAYAAINANTGKVVTNAEIGEIVNMQPSTISLVNPFLVSVNLLQKADGGHLPSALVLDFLRAFEWTPETATHKFASAIRETWFAKALLPKLSFGPISEDDAIAKLAEGSKASKDYRGQLRCLLEYLQASGLIEMDSEQVRAAPVKKGETITPQQPVVTRPTESTKGADTSTEAKSVATAFSQTPQGAVQFHVSVRVDMGEFAGWRPDRIAAFFGGIAEVLSAKADVERSRSGSGG